MRPLTEREIKKILGSLLGALIDMVEDVETVRQAVIWFGSNDPVALNVWAAFKQIKAQMEKLRTMQPSKPVTDNGRKPD
jgi:hypothetical protein